MDFDPLQRQALVVEMPDENFDPTIEPTNGEEYLKKVIYERNQCPTIVVKPLRTRTTNVPVKDLQMILSGNIIDSSEESLRPTPEWKHYQLQDFAELRQKIVNLRRQLAENGFTSEHIIPLCEDEDAWKVFCRDNNPLLSIVLRIDQRSLECLVEFESNWLRELLQGEETIDLSGKEKWLGEWIYSTLACLHLPLEPSVFSILRDIARSCILLRNDLACEQEEVARPLNLFIFLISKYFNQLDLAEFV